MFRVLARIRRQSACRNYCTSGRESALLSRWSCSSTRSSSSVHEWASAPAHRRSPSPHAAPPAPKLSTVTSTRSPSRSCHFVSHLTPAARSRHDRLAHRTASLTRCRHGLAAAGPPHGWSPERARFDSPGFTLGCRVMPPSGQFGADATPIIQTVVEQDGTVAQRQDRQVVASAPWASRHAEA